MGQSYVAKVWLAWHTHQTSLLLGLLLCTVSISPRVGLSRLFVARLHSLMPISVANQRETFLAETAQEDDSLLCSTHSPLLLKQVERALLCLNSSHEGICPHIQAHRGLYLA